MADERRPWPLPSRRPAESAATDDEINELLEKVRDLRLMLTVDLSAAASAVEADHPEIAREILVADGIEVRRIGASSRPAVAPPSPVPSPRRRRALFVLPAIPLVGALAITGAAALSGSAHHQAPAIRSHAVGAQPLAGPRDIHETAASTLHHLERVVSHGHHRKQVLAVAAHLHRQLSELIATSPHDAVQLGEVQRLLSVEQRLLESHHGEAATAALAASRHLTHLLALAGLPTTLPTVLPAPTSTTSLPSRPTPTTTTPIKSHPSTPPTTVVVTPSTPTATTSSRPRHHHHHHGLPNPLFGVGAIANEL